MRKFILGSLLGLALPILSFGQVCAVDPLNGTAWAFSIHTPSGGIASIGTFRATNVGGLTISGVQTVNNQGQISRQEAFGGRYTLDGDCRGGEILISVGRHSAQLQFYFANGGLEMEIVSDETNYYLSNQTILGRLALTAVGRTSNVTFTGLARKLLTSTACAAGTNPLSILNATSYGFRTSNFGGLFINLPGVAAVPIYTDTAVAGIFDALAVNNGFGLTGSLAVTETISADGLLPIQVPLAPFISPSSRGGVYRGIKTAGRYIINSDCSGGEIMIMTNYQPIQYEFVFSSSDRSQMFLLSDSEGFMLQGVAKKY